MLQNYWGGGRYHPSTGAVSVLHGICLAYDLVYDATGPDGQPLWTPQSREFIERHFILEWALEAEPYVGGRGRADRIDNKSPRV